MNIKTSIYDFFAYTMPGGVLVVLLLHGLKTFGIVDYFSGLSKAGFATILILTLASYLTGFLMEPITQYVTKLYKAKEQAYLQAFQTVKHRNPDLDTRHINPADWALWFASIKRENLDIAFEIDHFLAYSKMMRGVCLSAIIAFFQVIIYVILGKAPASYLFLEPFLILFAILAILQSHKFRNGFYILIFETAISRNPPFTNKP